MKTQPVEIKHTTGPMGDEEHTHPAFGMIGLSQIMSTSMALVGSSVKHGNCIALTIHEAKKYRSVHKEHFHATKTICKIYLSHAQLAEMLFSMNNGDGVPCTLSYVTGDKESRPEAPYASPIKESTDDLKQQLQELLSKSREMAAEVETIIKNGLTKKADRKRASFLAMKIVQDIDSNLGFAAECVDKKMEKNVAHAKSEIDAFVSMTFRAAGIEHLKGAISPALIEDKKVEP